MRITKGIQPKPLKVVVYGPEGIGKSTFASLFPDPLFIDTEGSTARMDVARTETPTSLAMLTQLLTEIRDNPPGCRTLIIDTIDWAERLCIQKVCAENHKTGIEDFGYGKGYTYVYEEMGRILNLLNDIWECGMHIVLTAHAAIRKFEQPDEMGAYDRWELKLINAPKCNSCAMVKEWADMVLFANYKTFAVAADKDGKKMKARGGERVMYTSHNPCWDAKNRFGLAPELPFDFGQIAHIFGALPAVPSATVSKTENVPAASAIPAPVQQPIQQSAPPPVPDSVPAVPDSVPAVPDSVPAVPDSVPAVPVQTAPAPAPVPDTPPESVILEDFEEIYNPAAEEPPAGIPPALADLMRQNNVSEKEIRSAVGMRGYFPEDMPITAYPPDFVQGVLIGAWAQVFKLIKDNRELPF